MLWSSYLGDPEQYLPPGWLGVGLRWACQFFNQWLLQCEHKEKVDFSDWIQVFVHVGHWVSPGSNGVSKYHPSCELKNPDSIEAGSYKNIPKNS